MELFLFDVYGFIYWVLKFIFNVLVFMVGVYFLNGVCIDDFV